LAGLNRIVDALIRATDVKQKTATLIAFLTAPVVPLVTGAILTPGMGSFDFLTILVFAVIFYGISAVVTAAFGAPIFVWLLRINLVRWWSALLAGIVVGAAVAVIVRLPNLASLHDVWLLGLEGAASAFVFWLIWKQGRESSDTKIDKMRQETQLNREP
jgi:hypothetical protein